MLKTICIIATVFFALFGLITMIYFIILHFSKNNENIKSCIIVALTGNYLKDIRRVMYALERKSLFCDSPKCKVLAVDFYDNTQNSDMIKELFSVCPSVNIMNYDNFAMFLKKYL